MSNTAVERRVADIKRAGGNPAAAFVNGADASTPTVTQAHVEPVIKPGQYDLGGKALQLLSAKQMQAQTQLTTAQTAAATAQAGFTASQTKGQDIKNNIDNAFAMQVAGINLDLKTIQKQTGEKNYDLLEQTLKRATADAETAGLTRDMTAAKLAQFRQMSDSLVQQAIQQAKAGAIDLKALENIASVGGVEGTKMKAVVQTVLNTLELFLGAKRARR